jgi:hypothetical protein
VWTTDVVLITRSQLLEASLHGFLTIVTSLLVPDRLNVIALGPQPVMRMAVVSQCIHVEEFEKNVDITCKGG